MKNFVHPGKNLTAPAPSGGVVSGDPILIGAIFGVAAFTAAEDAEVEVSTEGVFNLPKATGAAWSFGDPLYWDAGAKKLTKTAGNNLCVGTAAKAADTGDAFGNVRIGAPASAGGLTAPQTAIADMAAISGGEAPTEAEHNAVITKMNAVLTALRGANIIAD